MTALPHHFSLEEAQMLYKIMRQTRSGVLNEKEVEKLRALYQEVLLTLKENGLAVAERIEQLSVSDIVGMCPIEVEIRHGQSTCPYWIPLFGGMINRSLPKSGTLTVQITPEGWIFSHPGLPHGKIEVNALSADKSFKNTHELSLWVTTIDWEGEA